MFRILIFSWRDCFWRDKKDRTLLYGLGFFHHKKERLGGRGFVMEESISPLLSAGGVYKEGRQPSPAGKGGKPVSLFRIRKKSQKVNREDFLKVGIRAKIFFIMRSSIYT